MKILLHSNQFDQRGTGKVPLDYALGLKNHFNYEVVMICSKSGDNSGVTEIQKHFKVIQYEGNANNEVERGAVKYNISKIVEEESPDLFYMVKWGVDDKVTPDNCNTGIHCVFEMSQPHGNVYAGVSEYIAKKYKQSLFVPHIIRKYSQTEDIRKKLNIPENFTVLGRHGGTNSFNLPFAKQALKNILEYRKDIMFLFLSTEKFIEHERVMFLPTVQTEQEKYNFIHACDIMLHARAEGETFGLAIGEFSATNKPVITWSGENQTSYDRCHLDLLGKKAIVYNEYSDLLDIMYSIKREDTINRQWDVYSEKFSEKNVINKFKEVFLNEKDINVVCSSRK